MSVRFFAVALALCANLFMPPQPARAAQSYDNCSGFIDTVPTTISTQGVWCLSHDLSTGITSGNAITIAANNVTIDCNDFKIGGLAAGDASQAVGIFANGRQNATIRHCGIRGFEYGIYLNGGSGHLVEDNRLDNNLFMGIWLYGGDNGVIRRNRIYDTGGATGGVQSYGIYAAANIDDNIVSGLFVEQGGGSMYGIAEGGANTRVGGNVVGNFDTTPTGGGGVTIRGISGSGPYVGITGNQVTSGAASAGGWGISSSGANEFCSANVVAGFATNITGCISSGNLVPP
jgi:parallel beta-helix repeat protein